MNPTVKIGCLYCVVPFLCVSSCTTNQHYLDDLKDSDTGTNAEEDYTNWAFSSDVRIDTTANGANVRDDVSGFPLLVRLDRSNFDFDQARPDGEDLRFASSDGTSIFHERERFDAADRVAEIWVLIPTVYGDEDEQYFTMYWGKPDAPDTSDGPAVFSERNGFAVVYHFGPDDPFRNSVQEDFSGADHGTETAPGEIGLGRDFDKAEHDYISTTGTCGAPADITVSLWCNAESTDANGGDAIQINNDVILRIDDPVVGNKTNFHWRESDDWFNVSSETSAVDAGWTQFTGVFKRDTYQRIYEGDTLKGTAGEPVEISYTQSNGTTAFGRHVDYDSGFNLDGQIDEIRIETEARNADWIKLRYQTERSDQNTVTVDGS